MKKAQWVVFALSVILILCMFVPELPSALDAFSSSRARAGRTVEPVASGPERIQPAARRALQSVSAQSDDVELHRSEARHADTGAVSERAALRAPAFVRELEALPIRYGAAGGTVVSHAGHGEEAVEDGSGGLGAVHVQSAVETDRGADNDSSDDLEFRKLGTARRLWNRASATASAISADLSRNLFSVSRVDVSGIRRIPRETLLRAAGLSPIIRIWSFRAGEVERKVESLPWVEEATVTFRPYPAHVTIDVQEAVPWIIAEYDHHSWLVSRRGKLLQTLDTVRDPQIVLDSTELPRLVGIDQEGEGSDSLASVNGRFLRAVHSLQLIQSVEGFPKQVERYRVLPSGGILLEPTARSGETTPAILVRLDTIADARNAAERLGAVLKDAKHRGERVQRIDLRFRNQAVVN